LTVATFNFASRQAGIRQFLAPSVLGILIYDMFVVFYSYMVVITGHRMAVFFVMGDEYGGFQEIHLGV